MSEKGRGYAHRIDIEADVGDVWRALTEPAALRHWCSPAAEIRPKQGGVFRASVDRVTELEAHIDVFDPGRRMRLIYLPASHLPPTEQTIVDDFILEPTETGTIIRLLGSGVPGSPDWDTQYRRLRVGWQQAITRLKVFVERRLKGAHS